MGDEKVSYPCPSCLVTREDLDNALALCRAECALHRQKAIQMIDQARRKACEDASEEGETSLEKAIIMLNKEIAEVKASQQLSEREQREFYRNVIYVLFGMIATIAVGFGSVIYTGGII